MPCKIYEILRKSSTKSYIILIVVQLNILKININIIPLLPQIEMKPHVSGVLSY